MKTILLFLLLLILPLILVTCKPCEPQIITSPGSQLLVKTITQNNWLVTLSILGIGAGFFAFMNGYKYSVQIMSACLVVLSVFIMLAKYAVWVAFLAMGTSVLLMGYTILIKHKALKEVIQGVQNIKKWDIPAANKQSINNTLTDSQSSTTTETVLNIKENLNE